MPRQIGFVDVEEFHFGSGFDYRSNQQRERDKFWEKNTRIVEANEKFHRDVRTATVWSKKDKKSKRKRK